MQNNYHSVILSASEESPESINKREILHYVQDDRAKRQFKLISTHPLQGVR